MTNPSWQEDLFGGRDKVYTDKAGNEIRLSQDAEAREANLEERGKDAEYPHYTHNWRGDNQWHHSPEKDTHSKGWTFEEKEESETEAEGENNTNPLF